MTIDRYDRLQLVVLPRMALTGPFPATWTSQAALPGGLFRIWTGVKAERAEPQPERLVDDQYLWTDQQLRGRSHHRREHLRSGRRGGNGPPWKSDT
jgi:hypothetical protein